MNGREVRIGVSGGIAAYKSAALVSQLVQAKNLGLPSGKLRHRPPQCARQFRRLGMLRRIVFPAFSQLHIGQLLAPLASQPFPDPINRAIDRQPLQKCGPVSYRLTIGNFQRRKECLLKAFVGVGLVSNQAIGRPPHGSSFAAYNLVPIDH